MQPHRVRPPVTPRDPVRVTVSEDVVKRRRRDAKVVQVALHRTRLEYAPHGPILGEQQVHAVKEDPRLALHARVVVRRFGDDVQREQDAQHGRDDVVRSQERVRLRRGRRQHGDHVRALHPQRWPIKD